MATVQQSKGASLRIVSLLPSATEMIKLVLNERDHSTDTTSGQLVGVSHECDYPGLETLPHLTASTIKFTTSADVDKQVRDHLATGAGFYSVDKELLKELKPDVIVTQSLCKVCSVDYCVVENIAAGLNPQPKLVDTNPQNLQEVLRDINNIGTALEMPHAAQLATEKLQARIDKAVAVGQQAAAAAGTRARVAFLEWTEPMFIGGHWTPQCIVMAGGEHPLNPATIDQGAGKSIVVTSEALIECDPDVIIVAPCGLDIPATRKELSSLTDKPWWPELRAVKEGKVWVVDGNQFFNRPGPRLVDALEWLVSMLHNKPEVMPADFLVEPL